MSVFFPKLLIYSGQSGFGHFYERIFLFMLPILYSFRRCPYAMRARMTLCRGIIAVDLREVSLRAKPRAMLAISDSATVPVLQLPDQSVLNESLDIMHWALAQSDPDQWLDSSSSALSADLIAENDCSFKADLDRYKYWDRFPAESQQDYRGAAEVFLRKLETLLADNPYLLGQTVGITDIAIFPFIRQFAFVDKDWFDQAPYPRLQQWLAGFLSSPLFAQAMVKYPVWEEGNETLVFP